MEFLEQVHLFATKWIEKFRDQKISYIELVDHYLADDCQALGFQMDCGHAFSEKYGDAAAILNPENRSWFILALSRLALLSGENPFLVKGELRKIRLVSNRLGYGPCPEPDEEVEQHITLNAEDPQGYRHGVPAFQSVSAYDSHGKHGLCADPGQ